MNTICVCGAGTMGSGIAQVAAAAGYTTILYDVGAEAVDRAKTKMEKDLQVLVNKQKITAEKKASTLANISFTHNITDCVADVVIEAIVERIDIKTSLFRQLAGQNSAHTIFASNTSSLSVTAIAAELPSPQHFAGLHFFNPAPVMKLVEIVKAGQSSPETISALVALTKAFGKTPVVCKDSPGFIVNRVARPFYIEALRIAEEGVADYATIDRLMERQGFRMGPFKLMDLIGNDVNYAVSCSVYEQLHQPERLKPSYLQKQKVEQGALGKKTGKGYYDY